MNSSKTTEQINKKSIDIDSKSIIEILGIFNSEDYQMLQAIKNVLPTLEKLIIDVIDSFNCNGRLFYVGAGTSGRLGILDASECPPTFGTDQSMVQGIIAGGPDAVFKSIEGAEDSLDDGGKVVIDMGINPNDVVIGISASGTTPYVLGALKKSYDIGAKTALIECNESKKKNYLNHNISIIVGAEIISGSTRMKAGTATKIILNMISTISMIKINKTHGNIMSDLKLANNKLLDRAIRTVSNILSVEKLVAKKYLKLSNGNIKIAIIMYKNQVSFQEAEKILSKNNNSLIGIID